MTDRELLESILLKLNHVESQIENARQDASRVESKLDSFREEQDLNNKLLIGDTSGIKHHIRDLSKDSREFRREVREWQHSTNRRIDNLEEKLSDMREALK
ncbi:hypothetical protein B1A99_20605 [Cohnella sp. CIP 111063]|jgi:hypothetical protein|uniref:hypothetical protein n=1 Tax=unclassified Cohnella TaxID=2636738 RepID=UPI000B8C1F11|nr:MULTISPECIES: hypothetical protein [unclassified Cohnella]OXS56173.1 hypothetical protein B1A99_20605 [Cohnella sp. CIP 111063]PRX67808.1 hypothetical protein B0G52_11427 [Cohnella sp. SGD-V74]